jgi:hypothetical protein
MKNKSIFLIIVAILVVTIVVFDITIPNKNIECGRYSATHNDLNLIANTFFANKFVIKDVITQEHVKDLKEKGFENIKDRWDQTFIFKNDKDSFILYSTGKNGRDENGSGDDIVYGDYSSKGQYCE